jgi:prevent-host-death family protein
MSTVNILEAKTHLSRLVEDIATGAQRSIVIARNGKPVARLVPIEQKPVKLGVLRGRYRIPDDIDVDNADIAAEFGLTKKPPMRVARRRS